MGSIPVAIGVPEQTRWVCFWLGESEQDAEELGDVVDREHADFSQKYFNAECPDRMVYHSMMNATIGDECVANMILTLVQT